MDFLFHQMCGPGFSPKPDLCSYLWVLDIAKGEDGSASSLQAGTTCSPQGACLAAWGPGAAG